MNSYFILAASQSFFEFTNLCFLMFFAGFLKKLEKLEKVKVRLRFDLGKGLHVYFPGAHVYFPGVKR